MTASSAAGLEPRPIVARFDGSVGPSIRVRPQQAWRDEALEPAAAWMQYAPVAAHEIDHQEPGGWQAFVETLAGIDIAGCDQKLTELMQPGIVTDHQQRLGCAGILAQELENGVRPGVVERVLVARRRRHRPGLAQALPGLARAPCVRHHGPVRAQRVMGHIGPELRRVAAATRTERAVTVGHAGLALLGLGVPEQHQAHGNNVGQPDRFLTSASLAWVTRWTRDIFGKVT